MRALSKTHDVERGDPIMRGLQQGDALILVDLQKDFLPGGSLGVPAGDTVIAPLNRCIAEFQRNELPIFLTRDWHPPDHCSFRPQGGSWPQHCIAGTPGAEFAAELSVPAGARIISKAATARIEAYSAFHGTSLAAQLKDLGCTRVFMGGLATDYCVKATALDAREAGMAVAVFEDAVRAVNLQPGDGQRALEEMTGRGVQLTSVERMLA
jgi:nicotinamidase/pyrazinamidase